MDDCLYYLATVADLGFCEGGYLKKNARVNAREIMPTFTLATPFSIKMACSE